MKRILLTLIILIAMCSTAFAGDHKHPTKPHSQEFERIKSLTGKWQGTISDHGKSNEIIVEYRLTSGGSAVVETLSPGTEHEMISVYHDKGDKLSMTHYCMLGNQPQLEVTKSETDFIDFNFAKSNSANLSNEMHMHALNISFVDGNTIVETWTANDATGKPSEPTILKLKRMPIKKAVN